MQHAGIRARRDDAGVGRSLRAVAAEFVQQLGFEVVFAQAVFEAAGAGFASAQHGGGSLHGAHMGTGGNLPGAAQDGDFVLVFDQPHFVEQAAQVVLAVRAFNALAGFGAHLVQPAIDLRFQPLVRGEGKPDGALIGQQRGHLFVQCAQAERGVHAQRGGRGFGAEADAVPDFALQIFRAAKQRALNGTRRGFTALARFAAGRNHQPRARLVKAGQIIKIAVVAVGKIGVAVAHQLGRSGQQRHATASGLQGAANGGAAFGVNRRRV